MATNTPPDVWAFIKEFFQRLGSKSPKFFQVISWISGIAAILTGLPQIVEDLGLQLPDVVMAIQNKVVAYAALWGLIISKLAVQRDSTLPAPEKLPFTAKKEADPSVDTTPSKGI